MTMSPYDLQLLVRQVADESQTENIRKLVAAIESTFPKSILEGRTGKECTRCHFRMHNRKRKCPNCHMVYPLKKVQKRPPPAPELQINECRSCGTATNEMIELSCGCRHCPACLLDRTKTNRRFCPTHKTPYASEEVLRESFPEYYT